MNALYIDFNFWYLNPNRNQIPHLLKNVFNKCDLYGPGYVSKQVLEDGIEKFVEKNGPYDFLISNEMVIFALRSKLHTNKTKNNLKKNYFINFPLNLLNEKIVKNIHNFFVNDRQFKKIAYLIETDFYNVRKEQIELLESINDLYFITFGKDLIEKKENLENLHLETFGKNVNNNWYNFVHKNKDRIISLPHFIDDRDSDYTPLELRKYDVNIPGVNYWYRKEVIKYLDKNKFSIPSKIHMKVFSLMTKLKLNPFSYKSLNLLYNYIFRRSIALSKVTVTCGSSLKWPLNKFFEIPAEGSLLVCYPFFNQEDLGFIDGETCIVMNDPKGINEKLKDILKNLEKYQKIVISGQQMVMHNHSLTARAKQIKQCINTIVDNTKEFNGAYWKDGKFVIL